MKGQNKKLRKSITTLILWAVFLELCAILGLIFFEEGQVFFLVMAELIVFLGIICLSCIISDAKKEEKRQQYLEQQAKQKSLQEDTDTVAEKQTSDVRESVAVSTDENASTPFSQTINQIVLNAKQKARHQKFNSYTSIEEICEKFRAYAWNRGVKIDEKTAESIVKAMVSAKCIFVKRTNENVEDILSVVVEFFSGESNDCIEFEITPTKTNGLLYFYQDNELKCTEFFKQLYGASLMENKIGVCIVKNLLDMPFDKAFADFIELFKNPFGDMGSARINSITLPQTNNRTFVLPQNTWFFFLLNGDEKLPSDRDLWSKTIEINGLGSKNGEFVSRPAVSYSQFNELIESGFDKNFPPLDIWKKLDKVEDFLCSAVGFKIDNVLARQIERFATIEVTCGATPEQAMDLAIAHKVLPALSAHKKEDFEQDGTTLKELLDGLFGADKLPECHKALSAMQLD